MMTKEGCTKISQYSEYVFSSSLSSYHIDCYCVKGLCFCFPLQLLIFIYYNNGVVDLQTWALLTRILWKVSDTQVTVKTVGLFQ